MDIKDFFRYFKRMKWVIILPFLICTILSGLLTYFSSSTVYTTTFRVIIGPQVFASKDGKFLNNITYVISDIVESDRFADNFRAYTGLDVEKAVIRAMLILSPDERHQRVEATIINANQETVSMLLQKVPDLLANTAKEMFNIENLMVERSAKITESGKSYKRNMLAGAVGGLGLGCMIIFIFLMFDNRLRDKETLKRLHGIDYLGSAVDNARNTEIQSMLCTRLLIKLKNGQYKALVNMGINTGNSEELYNIGKCLADLGKKVLLIDANDKSTIASKTSDGRKSGFTDVLSEKSESLPKAVYNTDTNNLYIMPFGTKPELDIKYLNDSNIKEFLGYARDNFDVTLFSLSDNSIEKALLLSYGCDGALLMVREGHTNINEAEDIIRNFKDAGVKIAGYYTCA